MSEEVPGMRLQTQGPTKPLVCYEVPTLREPQGIENGSLKEGLAFRKLQYSFIAAFLDIFQFLQKLTDLIQLQHWTVTSLRVGPGAECFSDLKSKVWDRLPWYLVARHT